MNQKKVQPTGKVPFSWENKPGFSKLTNHKDQDHHDQYHPGEEDFVIIQLPPPPCRVESNRISTHDIQIPLPPCTFQPPPSRSSSRKGLHRKHVDDPFLAAYKECTKSSRKSSRGTRRGIFDFSCKSSISVREGNLVKVSQLPTRDGDRGSSRCS